MADIRAREFWPNPDQRIIIAFEAGSRVETMTDQELIDEHNAREREKRHLRIVE